MDLFPNYQTQYTIIRYHFTIIFIDCGNHAIYFFF